MSEAGWVDLARAAAQPGPDVGSSDTYVRELLVVESADASYAIPIERVREIVPLRSITPIPRVPSAVRGIISLRGEIFQVIDLRVRLGSSGATPRRQTRIVVLHGDEGSTAGLLVDAARDVVRVPEDALRPPPPGASPAVAALCPLGAAFVSLLDMDGVLDVDGR